MPFSHLQIMPGVEAPKLELRVRRQHGRGFVTHAKAQVKARFQGLRRY
jgi:hypothetical protein